MKRILAILLISAAAVSCGRQQKADPVAEAREHIALMAEANTTAKRNAEKSWAADSLDLNVFSDEGLRTRFLHEWVGLYRGSSGDDFPGQVTAAAKVLLLRASTEAPSQVKPTVRILGHYLFTIGYTGAAAAIAAYPYGFDISPYEYSEIAERLLGATLLPGQPAPAIEGAGPMSEPAPSATLLLFYETGCNNCGPLIDELIGFYEILASMNVRVVTVSSDTDPQIFADYAAGMPWPDRLCDLQAFAGPNFRNWWVASTPTMWLIDSRGIVVDQYRDLSDTGLLD